MVGRVVVVRRDGDGDVLGLGGNEQALDILDRVVVLDAWSNHTPGDAVRAEEVDLRVGHHKRGARQVELHVARRQGRLGRLGIRVIGGGSGRGACSNGANGGGCGDGATQGIPAAQMIMVIAHSELQIAASV